MQVNISQEQEKLRAAAREVAQGAIRSRAADVDRTEEYPWDNVERLKDAGFLGMTIPKAYGGKDASWLDAVLLIEEMSKVCSVTGRIAVETNMGAVSAIMAYGSEDQKRFAADMVLEPRNGHVDSTSRIAPTMASAPSSSSSGASSPCCEAPSRSSSSTSQG